MSESSGRESLCSAERGREGDRVRTETQTRGRHRRVARLLTLFVTLAAVGSVSLSTAFRSEVRGVRAVVSEIADSGSYMVYHYAVTNSAASNGGIAGLEVDVSAARGRPNALPATGSFLNGVDGAAGTVLPYAPVGPITPRGWTAALNRYAVVRWYPETRGTTSMDSIPPGHTLEIGLRSTYLPAIVDVHAEPTWQACCWQPLDSAEGDWSLPDPSGFSVNTKTVGPRYEPSEMTLGVLVDQLAAVCADPLWIDDAELCTELTDSLQVAEARFVLGEYELSLCAVDAVTRIVEVNRAPGGAVGDNAYWLLKTNGDYLVERYPGPASTPGCLGER